MKLTWCIRPDEKNHSAERDQLHLAADSDLNFTLCRRSTETERGYKDGAVIVLMATDRSADATCQACIIKAESGAAFYDMDEQRLSHSDVILVDGVEKPAEKFSMT